MGVICPPLLSFLLIQSCRTGCLLVDIIGNVVAQRKQAVREVDVLNDGAALGSGKLNIGEVPYGVDAVRGEHLGRLDCVLLRDTQDDDINMVFVQIVGQGGHIKNGNTLNLSTDKLGLDIEGCLEVEAPGLEREVAHKCLTYITDADKNGGEASVHTEDGGDLRTQCGDLITVALLTKLAESAEVLPDLRWRQSELTAKLTGGDAAHAGFGQLVELSQITGHTADNIVRDFDSFHG